MAIDAVLATKLTFVTTTLRSLVLGLQVGIVVVVAGCGEMADVPAVERASEGCLTDASLCGAAQYDSGAAGSALEMEPKDYPESVNDTVGVFVSPSGSDGNDGTKATPVRSIQEGLRVAARNRKARVYVCAGVFEEPVKIENGIGLFGGFACNDWRYLGSPARIRLKERGVPLTVVAVALPVVLVDLDITSHDAVASGESSVGAFVVNSSDVTMRRVTVTAGRGVDGKSATIHADYSSGAPDGNDHSEVNAAFKGFQTVHTCPAPFAKSTGGAHGQPGTPVVAPADPVAADGRAGGMSGTGCGHGSSGSNGLGGLGGAGATGIGRLESSGWQRADGLPGTDGSTGQGGGGGAGATAGGGGPGGCGGTAGEAGQGGGSSFALLSFESVLKISDCRLHAGAAGRGGPGGQGQRGQRGSMRPGNGALLSSCDGGLGGHGGSGGGGGGGAGGSSVAIGYHGMAPIVTGALVQDAIAGAGMSFGSAGLGGPHGAGPATMAGQRVGRPGEDGRDGVPGIAKAVAALP